MSDTLRVMRVVEGTSVDGPGLRTSIYLAGCNHRCPGCHNPSTWPFDAGEPMTVDEIMEKVLYNRFNVTLTGGDPLYHAEALLSLAKRIREAGLGIWIYTGFTLEELQEKNDEATVNLLALTDVLVDGPFIEKLKDPTLIFRGSSNQRLIDLRASEAQGKIIEYNII